MLDDAAARQTTCSVLGRSGAARHPDDPISRRVGTVAFRMAILRGCPAPGGPRYHVSSGSNPPCGDGDGDGDGDASVNPDFKCGIPIDCEESDWGWECGDNMFLDDSGCPRKNCTEDRTCPDGFICYSNPLIGLASTVGTFVENGECMPLSTGDDLGRFCHERTANLCLYNDNANFECGTPVDCSEEECDEGLLFDKNGCPRKTCTDDADCPDFFLCSAPADCFPSTLGSTMIGEDCMIEKSDDCDGRYCMHENEYTP